MAKRPSKQYSMDPKFRWQSSCTWQLLHSSLLPYDMQRNSKSSRTVRNSMVTSSHNRASAAGLGLRLPCLHFHRHRWCSASCSS